MSKVTCPILTGIFPRKRLFCLLDRMRKQPVIVVLGPPGSGKTTLVASYLDSRKLPCLWYQMDEGDIDPATFFYYLGQAAKRASPRKRKTLPFLTPEYLQDVPTFTYRYFEELYSRLIPPNPPLQKGGRRRVFAKGGAAVGSRTGESYGYFKYLDPDGDFFFMEGRAAEGEVVMKFLSCTGKWKGIKGEGRIKVITQGRRITPDTNQICYRHTGTFELSKK